MKKIKKIILIILLVIGAILTPFIFKDQYRSFIETTTEQCLYGCPTSKKVKKTILKKRETDKI